MIGSILALSLAVQVNELPKLTLDQAMADPPLREAIIDLFSEVGVMANLLGQCERFLPEGEGDEFVATVLRQNEMASQPEFQAMLRSTFADVYAEGRIDPERYQLTAEICERAMLATNKEIEAKAPRLASEFTAARRRLQD